MNDTTAPTAVIAAAAMNTDCHPSNGMSTGAVKPVNIPASGAAACLVPTASPRRPGGMSCTTVRFDAGVTSP